MIAAAAVIAFIGALCFLFLSVVAVVELAKTKRGRAVRPFGLAFLLVALTSAAHHGLLGLQLFEDARELPGARLATLVMLLVPLLLFVGLRVESLTGERAERFVPGLPAWLAAVPLVACMVAGACVFAGVEHALQWGVDPLALVPDGLVFALHAFVGALIVQAQAARRRERGGWSVSSLSLAAVFPANGLVVLLDGILHPHDQSALIVGAVAVPAAILFLVVVRRLHRRALRAHYRRPIVGPASADVRRSPWAKTGATAG